MPGLDDDLRKKATIVLTAAREKGLKIATAESCTGGLIAATLTEIAGSSDVVDRGFVTYSNEAKMAMLGVTERALIDYGAVSEIVARAMAAGAVMQSDSDLAVSCTGIAGPGGGTDTKPVGLVHIAAALRAPDGNHQAIHSEQRFGDIGRAEIRHATVLIALDLLLDLIDRA